MYLLWWNVLLDLLLIFLLDYSCLLSFESSLYFLNTSPLSDVFCTYIPPICGWTLISAAVCGLRWRAGLVGRESSLCKARPPVCPLNLWPWLLSWVIRPPRAHLPTPGGSQVFPVCGEVTLNQVAIQPTESLGAQRIGTVMTLQSSLSEVTIPAFSICGFLSLSYLSVILVLSIGSYSVESIISVFHRAHIMCNQNQECYL